MQPVLYSHRLKNVLQLMVRDLGLTLVLDDQQSDLDLAANEAMIREAVAQLGIQMDIQTGEGGTTITFF